MKTIANWILESVAATVVIVVCMGVFQMGDLPSWTLAFTGIPIVLYLGWRLNGQAFDWRKGALFAAILGSLIFIQQELLPASWRSWSFYLVPIIVVPFGFLLRPKRTETHRPT